MRKLLSYWYIPLLAIVALVGVVLMGRRSPFTKLLGRELSAIDAGAQAKKDAIDQSVSYARAKVEERYADTIKALDEKQYAEAQKLKHDPVALAKALARLSK